MKTCSLSLYSLVATVAVLGLSPSDLAAQVSFSEAGLSVLGGANFDSRSASLADYDDDGDLDLFFQGGSGAQQLLRNNLIGNGSLTYTSASILLPSGLGPSWSAAWGDYDGDRKVDVFVGQSNIGGTGDVLHNNGGTGFSNTSNAVGLNDPGFHQNVAWNDIDNDRDLDLIIAMEGPTEKHEIYLQQPSGNFAKVGAIVGFQESPGVKAYGMAIGDTDGDGDLDIYISTCRADNNIRNHFYENQLAQTGVLGFTDIADTNGTQFMTNSYGTEFHDFDDDGDLDLFMVGADTQPSKLWRNDGGNQFTDIDTLTGNALLTDTAGDLNGGRAVDYDNDGDLDLFFHDHAARVGSDQARKLYRNDGNWEFTDVTSTVGISGDNAGSYDSTWGDIDLDGDQDLIATTSGSSRERVYLSDATNNGNHWLYVELIGPTDNTTGIGATIYATVNQGTPEERTIRREANTNAGTFNQSDLPVHLGLGDSTTIDELRIVWRDGTEQTLFDVAVDQYLAIATTECDFDADGGCDVTDLNMLLAEGPVDDGVAVTEGVNDQFDLTGDFQIDLDDRDEWLSQGGLASGFDSPFKLGDANLDGFVDGQDFLQWNSNKFTSSLRWDNGDFNADGTVDGADFLLWNAAKFTGSNLSSVPEPAGLAWLLGVALVASSRLRGRGVLRSCQCSS
jgi:hypothetical protein